VSIYFITGPEGSGTTVLVRALTNHPGVVKGDAARYGHPSLHGRAGAQLIPAALMSTRRAGIFNLADPAAARRCLGDNATALFAAQPGSRAIFFKYSTPASRPHLWPVFLPLFELPEFRVIVIWRRPMDSIYSAFRRFYRSPGRDALGLLAAARSYARAVRHIRRQLGRSPRDRWFSLTYEGLVTRPEAELRSLYAFADLPYCPAEQLLPDRGFSNENGKWKRALRTVVAGAPDRADAGRGAKPP
jgi:hypothetical protein